MNLDPKIAELLNRTAEALAKQHSIPLSPGKLEGHQPQLCAAAAFVHQASAAYEPKLDSSVLARTMVSRGKDFILAKAAALNLDTEFVLDIMRVNDACSDDERPTRMPGHLVELATARSAPV